MLPNATVPPNLQRLLNHFWPCFTRPTFATFTALLTGLITHTGPRTVCGMLTGSGLARLWPHHRAHTFFSHRRWDPHHLGRTMARLIAATCTPPGQDLTLIVDDTLIKRQGARVFGRYRQHDGAGPADQPMNWGVCYVVTALAAHLPGKTKALALPTLISCWRPARTHRPAGRARKQGHAPHPHTAHLSATAATARVLDHARARYTQARNGLAMRLDQEAALPAGHRLPGPDPKTALKARLDQREHELDRARTDHDQALERVLQQSRPAPGPAPGPDEPDRPTKTETAIALATQQARLFADRTVHVVADAAYHSPALRALPANLTWTFRLMSSAVLSQPPPPARPGSPTRPGRPAHAGPRLGTAAQIAAQAASTPAGNGTGQQIAVLECRWPRSLGPLPLRLVLVRHARSRKSYDLALLTTDTTSTAEEIVQRYTDRWPIEVCFQDSRAHLGLEQARNRTRAAVERTVPFQLLAYSLVVLWYLHHGNSRADVAARRRDQPWYRSKTEPAFSDMIAALREQVIEHRISCRVPDLGVTQLIREIVQGRIDTAA
ncbi:IS701 family transposase [Nocardiopsis salina]|uniref:IS701 family transposase n=1 Tax=Nocardiopsis salina TaxID=245836 RepID=UPI00034A7234|nr:transposase [Nocardiopsis salina]